MVSTIKSIGTSTTTGVVNIATLLSVIFNVIVHFKSHTRPDGVHCSERDCVLEDRAPIIFSSVREVLNEIPAERIADQIGCPQCGFEYSIIPRYAMVASDGRTPYLSSTGHVITGSKEEIDLMCTTTPGAQSFELLSLRGRTALLRREYAVSKK